MLPFSCIENTEIELKPKKTEDRNVTEMLIKERFCVIEERLQSKNQDTIYRNEQLMKKKIWNYPRLRGILITRGYLYYVNIADMN